MLERFNGYQVNRLNASVIEEIVELFISLRVVDRTTAETAECKQTLRTSRNCTSPGTICSS